MRLLLGFTLIFSSLFAGHWQSDYDGALLEAQKTKKPLMIAFLGTKWCPWSQKLENEVLSKEKFAISLDSFILVKLDFSNWKDVDGRCAEIKNKFDIQEVPVLLLLDSSEREMARLGYVPYSAEEFTSLLLEIKASYEEIAAASFAEISLDDLQDFYLRSLKFGFNSYRYELLARGLQIDKSPFFLLEKYKLLVESGKQKDKETFAVRKELLKRDPKNQFGVHRTLAIVDFHQLSQRYRLRKKTEEVVKPLLEYIKKFGEDDPEHLWKIEMMIAKFYFNREKLTEALSYAEQALAKAPETAREEIIQSISFLKAKM